MTDSRYTRCPGCATVFRVAPAQLALRQGQVRCGHCRAVFDANDHFVSLDAGPPSDEFDAIDELALGRPTVTLRSAEALHPLPRPVEMRSADAMHPLTRLIEAATPKQEVDDERTAAQPAVGPPASDEIGHEGSGEEAAGGGAAIEEAAGAGTSAAPGPADTPHAGVPAEPAERSVAAARPPHAEWTPWKRRTGLRELPPRVYVAAVAVLALALVAQLAFAYRSALAAHLPATRPLLGAMCGTLGCSIEPLRDSGALSIDASDLQADPAHRGLLLLTATIRNRAAYAIAYPYLELTLTDASDSVVVRRAFPPSAYLGNLDATTGLPPNGERLVRLFIDASATQQAGYRLYLFYP
jgi:predicted Zn finger-like uncharacterized protein